MLHTINSSSSSFLNQIDLSKLIHPVTRFFKEIVLTAKSYWSSLDIVTLTWIKAGITGGLLYLVYKIYTLSIEQRNRYTQYLDLLARYPQTLGPLGDHRKGEIEIITDRAVMAQVEAEKKVKIGIISEDQYIYYLRDAVRFPNGSTGTYLRVIQKSYLSGVGGVVVIPVCDQKIILNLMFRHATRAWELEPPRGFVKENESAEDAAKREALKEAGMVLKKLTKLGTVAVDTGLTSSVVPLYIASIASQTQPSPAPSEAIKKIKAFSLDEIKEGLRNGYITLRGDGQERNVYLRDAFLTACLGHVLSRGISLSDI